MSSPYLLDANALIALTLADHEHHPRVKQWAADVDRIAVCPIVEGALVRFLIRLGQSQATAKELLAALRSGGRCEFWPDSVSYCDTDLSHVVGHRQVTDAYLTALAEANGGLLATLDQALARVAPRQVVLIG
ncbi:MAG: TA system VapC family ribonuclease toxin [Candidatus Nanopelagicales bacterium]